MLQAATDTSILARYVQPSSFHVRTSLTAVWFVSQSEGIGGGGERKLRRLFLISKGGATRKAIKNTVVTQIPLLQAKGECCDEPWVAARVSLLLARRNF
jgi:hypothetical protein